jgi:hypothetical protein
MQPAVLALRDTCVIQEEPLAAICCKKLWRVPCSSWQQDALVGAMQQLVRNIGFMQYAAFSHWPQEALVSCTMQKVAARGIDDMHHAACHLQQLAARGIGAMQHAFWEQEALLSCSLQHCQQKALCHAACSNWQ